MQLEEMEVRAVPVAEGAVAIQLRPGEIVDYWEELTAILDPAAEESRGEFTAFTLLHNCFHGESYLFAFIHNGEIKGALVASLLLHPCTKVCFIDAYAGDLKLFYPYLSVLEIWASQNGCWYMEAAGTEASERLARRHGFYHSHQIFRKPLGAGGNMIQ